MPYPLHHPATCVLTSHTTLTTRFLYAPLTPSSEAQGEILVDLAEYENDDEVDDGRRDAGDRRRLRPEEPGGVAVQRNGDDDPVDDHRHDEYHHDEHLYGRRNLH